jgi:hypothetical protein
MVIVYLSRFAEFCVRFALNFAYTGKIVEMKAQWDMEAKLTPVINSVLDGCECSVSYSAYEHGI